MEKYEKVRIVGRGAYGTVYLSKRLTDNKLVILKQIPVEQMTKEERQAALNEVKVLSMLSHPNIIEYYENFLEDKALMICMEYAEGGTLFEYLQERHNQLLEEEDVLHYLAQLLLSIQHIHSKQILHRDLKTQNILLDKGRRNVKIGDFGISKVLSSKSKAYTVVGTPCYISPELCEGKPYNQKSDIWALGCVLYELASLKRAFEAQNLPALVLKIMRGTFAPVSDQYSEELRVLIFNMLHLDPNKRPNINQVMATPILICALMKLYADDGAIPCRAAPRPVSKHTPRMGRSSRVDGGAKPIRTSSHEDAIHTSIYCWGGGIVKPRLLALPSKDTQVTQVSVGRTQKAAVTKNGRLIRWEMPGVGVDVNPDGSEVLPYIPRYLEGQSAVTIQQVSCGDLFIACLTDRGILMTFGSGASGSLGHGNYNDVVSAKIVEALLGEEVVELSCGASHVLVVTADHKLFAWGRGDTGRLGLPGQAALNTPRQVALPAGQLPARPVCGVDASAVITHTGRLLCAGSNRFNKLCLDDGDVILDEVHTFHAIASELVQDQLIVTVSMGTAHTALVTDKGVCYMVGSNQFGQLGCTPDAMHGRRPQKLKLPGRISSVSCGDACTIVVTGKGVYSFGKGQRGRLGRVTEEPQVPGLVTLEGGERSTVTSLSSSHGVTVAVVTRS